MLLTMADTTAPVIPSCGKPKPPSTSAPDKGTGINALIIINTAGGFMSPMPRKISTTMLISQRNKPPLNSIRQTVYDCSKIAPWPPRKTSSNSAKTRYISRKNRNPITAHASECHTDFSARAISPAPIVRTITEVTAPPIKPPAIVWIRIRRGNAKAIAASDKVPSQPINYASAMLAEL